MDMTSKQVRAHPNGEKRTKEGSHGSKTEEPRNFGSGLTLAAIFAVFIIVLGVVFYMFPHLEK